MRKGAVTYSCDCLGMKSLGWGRVDGSSGKSALTASKQEVSSHDRIQEDATAASRVG